MASTRLFVRIPGAFFRGDRANGIDFDCVESIADQLRQIYATCQALAVSVGGGNIVRGIDLAGATITRRSADTMGMLATLINLLALEWQLNAVSCTVECFSSIGIGRVVERFTQAQARSALDRGRIVLLGGGIGTTNQMSSDVGAMIHAQELRATDFIKLSIGNPQPAQHFTFDEALMRGIRGIDQLCLGLGERKIRIRLVACMPSTIFEQCMTHASGTFIGS